MQTLEFVAAPQDAGQRMDRWLSGCCGELSRSALQALMEQGTVLRNGQPVNKKDKVMAGDTVLVTLPDPQPIEAQPQDIPLDIVFEDDHLLVVNKPKGWWCIRPPAIRTVPWSTRFCITAQAVCPVSAAPSAPALFIASTRTPVVCWWWPKDDATHQGLSEQMAVP